jgi:hypothetical protein
MPAMFAVSGLPLKGNRQLGIYIISAHRNLLSPFSEMKLTKRALAKKKETHSLAKSTSCISKLNIILGPLIDFDIRPVLERLHHLGPVIELRAI